MTTTRQRNGVLGPAGLLVVTLLVLLAVWTAAAGGRWAPVYRRTVPEDDVDPSPAPPPTEPAPALPEDFGMDLRGVVLGTLVAILIVVLVVGLGAGLKAIRTPWQRRDRDQDPDPGADGDLVAPAADVMPDIIELREGIAEAWSRLVEHREPSDAIQAAWVAVEQAAGRSGVERAPSATPTEFTVAVLDRTKVDPSAIRTLLGLYHRARFSTHPATDDDVALARECLTRLDEGLAP